MLSWLRAYLFIDPLNILATAVMGTLSLLASAFDKSGRTQHYIACRWARMVLAISGVRLTVEGLEKLDANSRYVLVANHRSYMDTPAVLARIPLQFRFFANASLFGIPLLGGHLRRAGHLPVRRENPRVSLKSLSDGARLVQERNVSVLLFPEGGRSPGAMRPFLEGAAYLAIKAGVPVVPIGIMGTRTVLPMDSLHVRPGPVVLRIGDPIPTAGMHLKDRGELTQTVWHKVAELAGEPSQSANPSTVS